MRCRRSWQNHILASRAFLVRNSGHGKHVAVLGSGHLHDIDIRHLKKNFDRITLIDIVHPLEVRLLAAFSGGVVRLVSGDLSGALHVKNPNAAFSIERNISHVLKDADTMISACVLTQLPLPACKKWSRYYSEEEVSRAVSRIQDFHIEMIKKSPVGILLTDTAKRYGEEAWTPMLGNAVLSSPVDQWTWEIASQTEHGLKGTGPEQRLVEAFVFRSPSARHENLCPIELAH